MTQPSATASSPYLSLRQAVRPAIYAHRLLAGDAERAGKLAAECADLLHLTRELLVAAGHVRLIAGEPGTAGPGPGEPVPGEPVPGGSAPGEPVPGEPGGDRQARLLDAYADAAMGWAKVVGSLAALGGTLLDRGDWDEVRRLAGVLADVGELGQATDLRVRLGQAIWATYHDRLQRITNAMPPADIAAAIGALRAVLREVPEDFPDRNREVNRLLAPLAAAIHALMKERSIEIPYDSRVEHIAAGGVARYPDIVQISLDELSAEFEGACK